MDDDIDEFLERERVEEKQRLESQLDEVDDILSNRDGIHEAVKQELDKQIQSQKDRLQKVQQKDEPRIRSRLEELYRERRDELLSNWRDRQSLLEKKMELQKEIDEVESVLDLDLED